MALQNLTFIEEISKQKEGAVTLLDGLLLTITENGREPDIWERHWFQRACNRLASGNVAEYSGIEIDVEFALLPKNERRPGLQIMASDELDRLDLETMKKEFSGAKGEASSVWKIQF